jgi:hypothetical protein
LTGESIPRMLWRLVFTRECFPGVRLSLQSRQGSLDTALIDWLVR